MTRLTSHLTDYRQTIAKASRRKGADTREGREQGRELEGEEGEVAKLSSWMFDHSNEAHGGKEVRFDFHVTGTFTKPLYRQVDEADRIEEGEGRGQVMVGKDRWRISVPLLNRKHEYYAPRNMQYNFNNTGRFRPIG